MKTDHSRRSPALVLLALILLTSLLPGQRARVQAADFEGIRFKSYSGTGMAAIVGTPMAVGVGTYSYQYGSNATYEATLEDWWDDTTSSWVTNSYSITVTNRWNIAADGSLVGDPNDYNTWAFSEVTWYSNGVSFFGPFGDSAPYFPAWQNRMAHGTLTNYPNLRLTNVSCALDLVIQGNPDLRNIFTNDVIAKFSITATDADTGQTIPDSDITLCGKTPINGIVWEKFSEWSTNGVTPSVTNHANYTFELTAELARPQIFLDTTNITGLTITNWPGTTNKIYVGELFWSYITLGSWTSQLTNCAWTLPATPTSGFSASETNGFEIPFVYATHATNDYLWCYFKSDATNGILSCQAFIGGEWIAPSSLITITKPPVSVAWDTNQIAVDTNHLHFGANLSWADAGVKFTNSIIDDAIVGRFLFAQTVTLYRERHYLNGTTLIKEQISGSDLLDTDYPYGYDFDTTDGVAVTDSPGSPTSSFIYRKITDTFSMHLMWTSARANSMPVTRWKFDWVFYASATNDVNTLTNGGWSLVPGYTGNVTASYESQVYPWWTNNVVNIVTNWTIIP